MSIADRSFVILKCLNRIHMKRETKKRLRATSSAELKSICIHSRKLCPRLLRIANKCSLSRAEQRAVIMIFVSTLPRSGPRKELPSPVVLSCSIVEQKRFRREMSRGPQRPFPRVPLR